MNTLARPLMVSNTRSASRHSNAAVQKSRSNVLGAGVDAKAFKAWFLPRWSAYLRANFRNQEEVATVFGVRFQTACNWWNADNCPSGDTVALTFLRFPDAQAWFLNEMEGR